MTQDNTITVSDACTAVMEICDKIEAAAAKARELDWPEGLAELFGTLAGTVGQLVRTVQALDRQA